MKHREGKEMDRALASCSMCNWSPQRGRERRRNRKETVRLDKKTNSTLLPMGSELLIQRNKEVKNEKWKNKSELNRKKA